MILRIPTPRNRPYLSQRVQLEGREYSFFFHWSQLESAWYLDLATVEEEPLINGIKLLTNVNLLRRSSDPRLPPGLLFVVDLVSNRDPDYFTLGNQIPLYYVTST